MPTRSAEPAETATQWRARKYGTRSHHNEAAQQYRVACTNVISSGRSPTVHAHAIRKGGRTGVHGPTPQPVPTRGGAAPTQEQHPLSPRPPAHHSLRVPQLLLQSLDQLPLAHLGPPCNAVLPAAGPAAGGAAHTALLPSSNCRWPLERLPLHAQLPPLPCQNVVPPQAVPSSLDRTAQHASKQQLPLTAPAPAAPAVSGCAAGTARPTAAAPAAPPRAAPPRSPPTVGGGRQHSARSSSSMLLA